jgi:hypothetical protein
MSATNEPLTASGSVTVEVDGGPTASVPYTDGMTARTALEDAWEQLASTLTYSLQYFGATLGYLVSMINETYDTFVSTSDPFFYWEFFVNGTPAGAGIDHTILNNGDVVAFAYEQYDPEKHADSLIRVKHEARAGTPR